MNTTRRTALKAIAAAIMAPTIHLRNTVPDERLLVAFCNPESFRYSFEKPFGVGSLTYATDSKAMIRCELGSRLEDGERHLPRNVLQVWERNWIPTQWRPLTIDDLRPTEFVNGCCPHCGDCRVSLGENYPEDQDHADSLPDWDPDNNTIRDTSCEHCRGKDYTGPSCVRIGGVLHQSWTLRRILALPNPKVCGKQIDDYGIVMFRADGFEGISLGIKQ